MRLRRPTHPILLVCRGGSALLIATLLGCGGSGGSGRANVAGAGASGEPGSTDDRVESGARVRDADGRDNRSFVLPERPADGAPACTAVVHVADLPQRLGESSGLAVSRRHPGIIWTHNDSGGEAAVYALDTAGRLVGTVAVTGARNRDWEDLALAPCGAGRAGDCLYIGDIGDNDRRRPSITVYRVPEPEPSARATAPAEPLTFRYPDGPHDAEALFILPGGSINIVTKGRHEPATLYRATAGSGEMPAELSRIQTLSTAPATIDRAVTGADASADGRWVAIRSYGWLQLYHVEASGNLAAALPASGMPLEDAGEPQGEAVAIGGGGTLWLSTEGGPFGGRPFLTRLACRLP